MKTQIACLLLSALICFAQTNGNFTTLTVGDKIYTNCTVKVLNAAEGIVLFQGGGAKIKLADLPTEMQNRFNFDSIAAQEFLAKKKQADQTKAARFKTQQLTLQKLDEPISPPEKIKIVEITGSYGHLKCIVSAKGGQREILLSAVPAWITKTIKEIDQTKGLIKRAEQTIQSPPKIQTAPMTVKRSASGKSSSTGAKYAVDKAAVTDAKKTLSEAKTKLKDLQNKLIKADIFAAKTGKTYAGLSIWKCVSE